MAKLHVLFKHQELDPDRLQDKVVIVLDVLFATSTIVHALGQGIARIWPASTVEEALRIAARLQAPVLAGECLARNLPGFRAATPLALCETKLNGATLVYLTTNGTQALSRATRAAHVYAGALLNGGALARHVTSAHPGASVLLVCSGSLNRFNLEDFYGAGHIAAHFERAGGYSLTDAAWAALLLYRGCDAGTALRTSSVGRMIESHALRHEIDRAAQIDVVDLVPKLSGGCLEAVAA